MTPVCHKGRGGVRSTLSPMSSEVKTKGDPSATALYVLAQRTHFLESLLMVTTSVSGSGAASFPNSVAVHTHSAGAPLY